MRVVLASTSASRRSLLQSAGIPHEAVDPQVDEAKIKEQLRSEQIAPQTLAETLAETKAVQISRRIPQALVIGADQILATEHGSVLDKPKDMSEARRQLLSLRGTEHELISAVAVAEGGTAVWQSIDRAKLQIRDFSDMFLDDYLAREGESILSSVGSYRLEGRGVQLFSRIDGDYFTILGLPLVPLVNYLRVRGVLLQ